MRIARSSLWRDLCRSAMETNIPYNSESGMDRAAENHYPTMTLDDIKALPVPAISAKDCVLFLWATVPMLPQALDALSTWGFAYQSHFVWIKPHIGTGFWVRNKHELLLIGTKGHVPAPAPGEQYPSAITAPLGEHSAKPFVFREMIEDMFPTLPRLEMFARGEAVSGWDHWGTRRLFADGRGSTRLTPAERKVRRVEGPARKKVVMMTKGKPAKYI